MYISKNSDGSTGYYRIYVNGKQKYYHRVLWEKNCGKIPKNMCIDHIDGNTLNNELSNLRLVTHKQNHKNKKHHEMRGIFKRKNKNSIVYEVLLMERIGKSRKTIFCKRYKSLNEAKIVRDDVYIKNGYLLARK